MVEFHKTLSDRSVQLRYFGLLSLEERILHEWLRRVCFVDYDREIVLVVDLKDVMALTRFSALGA
jgi:acetyltransferase